MEILDLCPIIGLRLPIPNNPHPHQSKFLERPCPSLKSHLGPPRARVQLSCQWFGLLAFLPSKGILSPLESCVQSQITDACLLPGLSTKHPILINLLSKHVNCWSFLLMFLVISAGHCKTHDTVLQQHKGQSISSISQLLPTMALAEVKQQLNEAPSSLASWAWRATDLGRPWSALNG